VAILANGSLLREPTYRSYYAGQTVSLFGAAMVPVVMPLIAVLTLYASAFATSAVSAASLLPTVLFMLPIGAFVDRLPKRRAMMWANLGVAASLGVLPVLWWLDLLTVPVLCMVGFVSSTFAIVAQVADQSLIPYLVDENRLIEGNSKIALSESTAATAGPAAAGFLVTALGGPATIGIAAFGGMFSALTLFRIHPKEPPIEQDNQRPNLRRQIVEGLRVVWREPVLRTLMTVNGVDNCFLAWIQAIATVFYIRTLGWSASVVGLLLGVAAVGGIVASMFVGRLHSKLGTERLLLVAVLAGAPAEAVILLLHPGLVSMVVAVAAQFAAIFLSVCYSVTSRTLRQIASPDRLRGRITAAHRWVSVAVTPLGALVGGLASTVVGVRGSIAIACVGLLAAPALALASPLRRLATKTSEGQPA